MKFKSFIIVATFLLVGSGCRSGVEINTEIPQAATHPELQAKVDDLIKMYPNWGLQVYVDVANKEPRLGMTQEQVRAAFGAPLKITKTTKESVDETWDYGDADFLIFKNGVVVRIDQ